MRYRRAIEVGRGAERGQPDRLGLLLASHRCVVLQGVENGLTRLHSTAMVPVMDGERDAVERLHDRAEDFVLDRALEKRLDVPIVVGLIWWLIGLTILLVVLDQQELQLRFAVLATALAGLAVSILARWVRRVGRELVEDAERRGAEVHS